MTGLDYQRALERNSVAADVDIYDGVRDVYLGRLVNIHRQGLMLLGELPIDEDRLYQLDMHISAEGSKVKVLRIGVDCLWSRAADQDAKHWSGFSIIDSAPALELEIEQLVQAWVAP